MAPGVSTRTCSDWCDHSRGSECWEPSTRERIDGWVSRNSGLVGLGVVFGLLTLAAYLIHLDTAASESAWQKFHSECIQHRKEFECTAMWRAGNTDTVVVPVIVPVGR